VIRFAPPLTIDRETLDDALERIRATFEALDLVYAPAARSSSRVGV
jgi:acetylornithine/succinyldiaminopimelate/putrescine aminotransferase